MLLTNDGVRFVDWPHAHVGQAFVALVWFAPSVAMQGGPRPQESSPGTARPAMPTRWLWTRSSPAVAAYFTVASLQGPSPGLPTLRASRPPRRRWRRTWLADRTGWR